MLAAAVGSGAAWVRDAAALDARDHLPDGRRELVPVRAKLLGADEESWADAVAEAEQS